MRECGFFTDFGTADLDCDDRLVNAAACFYESIRAVETFDIDSEAFTVFVSACICYEFAEVNISFVAKAYEELKLSLAATNPEDAGREKYTSGKHAFIQQTLREAAEWSLSKKGNQDRQSRNQQNAPQITAG